MTKQPREPAIDIDLGATKRVVHAHYWMVRFLFKIRVTSQQRPGCRRALRVTPGSGRRPKSHADMRTQWSRRRSERKIIARPRTPKKSIPPRNAGALGGWLQ